MRSMVRRAADSGAKNIFGAKAAALNSRPMGSAGRRLVKNSQSTALLRANSAAAPVNTSRIMSELPQISRPIEPSSTKSVMRSGAPRATQPFPMTIARRDGPVRFDSSTRSAGSSRISNR